MSSLNDRILEEVAMGNGILFPEKEKNKFVNLNYQFVLFEFWIICVQKEMERKMSKRIHVTIVACYACGCVYV